MAHDRAYHSQIRMKIFASVLAAAIATPLLAQTNPSTPDLPHAPATRTILDEVLRAGPVMYALLALSIFSIMLVVVYLMTIRRGAVVSSGFMATADALLRKHDHLGLLAVSNRHGEAIARVVQKVLDFTTKNPSADFSQVRDLAETEGTRIASNLNNRVTYLADIGMIAPLIGLFGTAIGIMRAFMGLGSDLGTARYAVLSQGVGEALFNTCGGLAIGIPAMIFYAFFRGRVQRLISDLEGAVTHILALLSTQSAIRRPERTPVLLEDEL